MSEWAIKVNVFLIDPQGNFATSSVARIPLGSSEAIANDIFREVRQKSRDDLLNACKAYLPKS